MVVGLDGFQQINDLLGHSNGDLVLRAVADRLTSIGFAGVISRLSGDEFALAHPCATTHSIDELAGRVIAAFDPPIKTGSRSHRVKVSVGAAVFPAGGNNADELLSNGHLALTRAKTGKRGG